MNGGDDWDSERLPAVKTRKSVTNSAHRENEQNGHKGGSRYKGLHRRQPPAKGKRIDEVFNTSQEQENTSHLRCFRVNPGPNRGLLSRRLRRESSYPFSFSLAYGLVPHFGGKLKLFVGRLHSKPAKGGNECDGDIPLVTSKGALRV